MGEGARAVLRCPLGLAEDVIYPPTSAQGPHGPCAIAPTPPCISAQPPGPKNALQHIPVQTELLLFALRFTGFDPTRNPPRIEPWPPSGSAIIKTCRSRSPDPGGGSHGEALCVRLSQPASSGRSA